MMSILTGLNEFQKSVSNILLSGELRHLQSWQFCLYLNAISIFKGTDCRSILESFAFMAMNYAPTFSDFRTSPFFRGASHWNASNSKGTLSHRAETKYWSRIVFVMLGRVCFTLLRNREESAHRLWYRSLWLHLHMNHSFAIELLAV